MPLLIQIHPTGADKPQVAQLHPSADQEQLQRQFVQAVATDAVVEVPTVLPTQIESTTLHVRPKACAMWTFAQLTDEELQAMPTGNWVADLAKLAQQQKRQRGAGR